MRPPILSIALLLGLAACSVDSDVSRTIGARCDHLDECAERCLVDADDYPGGFCSVSCMADRDCPDGARCVDRDGGVCLFECEADPDCEFLEGGWICRSENALPDGEVMVCRGA